MANIEKLLKDFGEKIKTEKEFDASIFGNTGLTQDVLSAGVEDSLDNNNDVVLLGDTIKSIIDSIAEEEGISKGGTGAGVEDLTMAQIKSAEYIAPLAIDGITALKQLYGNPRKLDVGKEETVIKSYRYSNDDSVDVGIEYFDMQNVSTSLVFNVVYNAFAPKQDEFADLFFPMVTIDPVKAGARIRATLINIWKEYKHTINGAPTEPQAGETPLIKAITDVNLLTADNIKLVPVYRDSAADKFYGKVKFTETFMGETVTTAPLAFNKKVGLIGISQTDNMLAKGGADFTDSLNKSIKLKDVFVELTMKDGNTSITETFKFSLKNRNSWFYETITGSNKQMVLNFDEDNFFMLTPDTKAIDANGNEVDSKIMAKLPPNLEINLELSLTGQTNIVYGDTTVYFNALNIKEIRTKEGAVVTKSSDDYQKVAAVIETVKPGGYIIEAYASLANAKRKGITVLTRKETAVVTVPYRTGFTQYLPVVITGDDGDPSDLIGQIMGTRMKLNAYAIKTINEFISDMRANPKQRIQGLSYNFVNNYFYEETISLSTIADSIKSTERTEDIRAALINKINLVVTDMILKSNYKVARETLGYTGPIDVLVGMGLNLKLTIFGDVKQETVGDLRFNYGATPFEELQDKIVISLGVRNGNQNNDIDPLNFGVCLWSPELVINTKKTIGEGVRTEVSTFPRFLHYINLPIVAVFNISDVSSVAGKNIYITEQA